jgi:ATPase subunit of ABC transporter with duplicated ATPase domains
VEARLLCWSKRTGKSFIKAIVNEFEYEGDIKLGHNVQVGYFAQNQAEYLDGEIFTSNYGRCRIGY